MVDTDCMLIMSVGPCWSDDTNPAGKPGHKLEIATHGNYTQHRRL